MHLLPKKRICHNHTSRFRLSSMLAKHRNIVPSIFYFSASLTSQLPAHRSISGRAFKNRPTIPFISTQHHRSTLPQVSCTVQVMSHSRNSRANQQHGPSREGTLTGRHGGRPATVPAVPTRRRPRKALGWTGVRKRSWGGWATEIRIPRSRRTLWIGKFRRALEAALTYDATMFCFYGEHPPESADLTS
jgi:hypothetical protein